MELNADLGKSVAIDSAKIDWTTSQMKGVMRRMLERKGDEVAICATIVKYDPESYYDEHGHEEGEEFVVLEGVFSDNYGDFPAGTYVRNPPGSKHKPFTKGGCAIFVRLRQFLPEDQQYVRTNIFEQPESAWKTDGATKVSTLPLHTYATETFSVLKIPPQTSVPSRVTTRIEESFILKGSIMEGGEVHPVHSWIRKAVGSPCTWKSGDEECYILHRVGRSKHPEL